MARNWLTTPRPTNAIGNRWEDVLALATTLLAMLSLNAREEQFLEDTIRRLVHFEERTYMTDKQLQWLSDLDDRMLR